MLTLDEAIKHCEEIADNFDRTLARFDGDDVQKENTCACMNQHRQLAEWLKELKTAREELAEWHKLRLICAGEGIIVYKVKENE